MANIAFTWQPPPKEQKALSAQIGTRKRRHPVWVQEIEDMMQVHLGRKYREHDKFSLSDVSQGPRQIASLHYKQQHERRLGPAAEN